MATRVRSYSKINLGLAIGPVRADGFHGLTTLYQTLALHDFVTVTARRAEKTWITLTTNHAHVPTDARNTAWKMVEGCLERLGILAEVEIYIQKDLPVQGGMGAGSANAAAALLGLERELGLALPEVERLEIAAAVGSDVPLFLIGGAVLGLGRGEQVSAMRDFPATPCVIALPSIGVSTPRAFRDWDTLWQDSHTPGLTSEREPDRLGQLSFAYATVLGSTDLKTEQAQDASGIVRGLIPEKRQGGFGETSPNQGNSLNDLAESPLLALVRTGIENDFEQVVFPQYPLLREIKHELMGNLAEPNRNAVYAALSGSGSALFGLYRSTADAEAAQQRVQAAGTKAILTETLPRDLYWRTMFAE
jgi:4-diphosphocytidyl-2-C-methyl-D-erythritol kinase